jgi:hypothetical protein
MVARLITKAVFLALALGAAFFGIGLLGFALAHALVNQIGMAGAYAAAGGVLVGFALIVLAVLILSRPRKKPAAANHELIKVLLAGLAKDMPWLAIIGAGLAGAANMFLNRNKSSK